MIERLVRDVERRAIERKPPTITQLGIDKRMSLAVLLERREIIKKLEAARRAKVYRVKPA